MSNFNNKFLYLFVFLVLSLQLILAQLKSEPQSLESLLESNFFSAPVYPTAGENPLELGELEIMLAEKFSPIIHKHPEDKQADLANYNEIIEKHSNLHAIVIGSEQDYDERGAIHKYAITPFYSFCTLGAHYGTYIELDIDDDARYSGASSGNRPLYYHCYKNGEYYYLQYWYFLTMNDISDETGTWHEGDWEHVSLKIEYKNGKYVPIKVNFYNHEGGYTVDSSDAWWGKSTGLRNYQTMQKGYDEEHTKLHVWIAKDSHASYNRWDDLYFIDIDILNFDKSEYQDDVDFGTLNLLFEYDELVNMGEIYRNDYAHDVLWLYHNYHKPALYYPQMDGLAYVGRIGQFWVSSGSVFANFTDCKSPATPSPHSPVWGDNHEWLQFNEVPFPGFGNNDTPCIGGSSGGKVSWVEYKIQPDTLIDFIIPITTTIKGHTKYTKLGYEARNTIEADGIIEGDGTNGANVLLRAGKSIHLKPGFHAQRGSTFHAYIDSNLIE